MKAFLSGKQTGTRCSCRRCGNFLASWTTTKILATIFVYTSMWPVFSSSPRWHRTAMAWTSTATRRRVQRQRMPVASSFLSTTTSPSSSVVFPFPHHHLLSRPTKLAHSRGRQKQVIERFSTESSTETADEQQQPQEQDAVKAAREARKYVSN